jgi:hypothetical protein
MKKLSYILMSFVLLLSVSSCFDDDEAAIFTDFVVEFDATSRILPTGNPAIVGVPNGIGTVNAQVNLVGPQLAAGETLTFRVDPALTTAVEGTNFDLQGGTITLEAGTSIFQLSLNILNDAAFAGPLDVGIELVGNENVSVNPNFSRIVFRIQ